MGKDNIVIVDIGSSNINFLYVHVLDNGLEVKKAFSKHSEGVKAGKIIDFTKFKAILKSGIDEVKESQDVKIEKIVLGINNKGVRSSETTYSMKFANKKRINNKIVNGIIKNAQEKILILENEAIIDVITNFFIVNDKCIYKPIKGWEVNELGVNITVLVGDKEYTDLLIKSVEELGFEISRIVLNSVAIKELFSSIKLQSRATTMVEVGAQNTNITLVRSGKVLNVLSIPLGGDNITNDISICCNLPQAQAEKIKKILSSKYAMLKVNAKDNEKINVGTEEIEVNLFHDVINYRIEEILVLVKSVISTNYNYNDISNIIIYGQALVEFENIKNVCSNVFDKNIKIITKDYIGLQNSSIINSFAIVKYIENDVKLKYNEFLISNAQGRNNWTNRVNFMRLFKLLIERV